MNTTTRRIATTLVGVGLAASAFASTGPAAFAGKPSGGGGGTSTQPLTVDTYLFQDSETGSVGEVGIYYTAPVSPKSVKSVTCTLDGAAVDDCGWRLSQLHDATAYYQKSFLSIDGAVTAEHTFTVKVLSGKTAYVGTSTFTLAI